MSSGERHFTAPGKVVISGEYAVLHGAPAVAMAVARRAIVSVKCDAGGDVPLTLHAPGFDDQPRALAITADGAVRWQDSPPPSCHGLFEEVAREFRPSFPMGTHLVLDTKAFVNAADGRKLGLGSSAALAVALAAACADTHRSRDQSAVSAKAFAAHHRFQNSSGSGVDIAVASCGGLLTYRTGAEPKPVRWPRGLHMLLLWSGVSAQTPARIERLQASLDDASRHASLEALKRSAEQVAAAFGEGTPIAALDALAAYTNELERFDADQGLDIFAAGHAALTAAARNDGVVYKPCGAGGGDIGAVFGNDQGAVSAFAGRAEEAGFRVLDAPLAQSGVRREGSAV